MNHHRAEKQERRPTAKDLYRLALAIIAAVAIVRELRKPPEERTWYGRVVGFVPYDFRKPTMERFRRTYWNPEGSIISSKAWGVGWAPNFGALKRILSR